MSRFGLHCFCVALVSHSSYTVYNNVVVAQRGCRFPTRLNTASRIRSGIPLLHLMKETRGQSSKGLSILTQRHVPSPSPVHEQPSKRMLAFAGRDRYRSYQCAPEVLRVLVSLRHQLLIVVPTRRVLQAEVDHIADGPPISILINDTRMVCLNLQSCKHHVHESDNCLSLTSLVKSATQFFG